MNRIYKDRFKDKVIIVTGATSGIGKETAMQAAMEGTCDIGMASRELKDKEASSLTATTIAKDGIAIIVNKANSCEDLTVDQIKSIYTGETTVWSDVIK